MLVIGSQKPRCSVSLVSKKMADDGWCGSGSIHPGNAVGFTRRCGCASSHCDGCEIRQTHSLLGYHSGGIQKIHICFCWAVIIPICLFTDPLYPDHIPIIKIIIINYVYIYIHCHYYHYDPYYHYFNYYHYHDYANGCKTVRVVTHIFNIPNFTSCFRAYTPCCTLMFT